MRNLLCRRRRLLPHDTEEGSHRVGHHRTFDEHCQILLFPCGKVDHEISIDMEVPEQRVRCGERASFTQFFLIISHRFIFLVRLPTENTHPDAFFDPTGNVEFKVILLDHRITEKTVGREEEYFFDTVFGTRKPIIPITIAR